MSKYYPDPALARTPSEVCGLPDTIWRAGVSVLAAAAGYAATVRGRRDGQKKQLPSREIACAPYREHPAKEDAK